MIPVKSIKVALVALVGVAGSGLALQKLNDSDATSEIATAPSETAAFGPDPARPSAQDAERPVSGALVATPRHEAQPRVGHPPGVPSETQPAALETAPEITPTPEDAPPLRFAQPGNDLTAPPADAGTATTDAAEIAGAEDSTADACTPSLDLTAGPAATLSLMLNAPCHADAVAVISHDALRVAHAIPGDGVLDLSLPALSADAEIAVEIADLPPLNARATLQDAGLHTRYVLQWEGEAEFTLHAFHNGAGMGDAGHMHADNPFDAAARGAFTMVLGDPSLPQPKRAHVHSVPAVSADRVRFAIAAHQSDSVCGRAVRAETLGAVKGQRTRRTALSVTMPDCDADGGFVLLPVPHEKALALR